MTSLYMTMKESGIYFPLHEKLELLAHEFRFWNSDEEQQLNAFSCDIVDPIYGEICGLSYSFYSMYDE